MSVRAAGIPVTSALSSPAILDILPPSAALPVMAVAILSVWAAHCAPEVSTVHEPASEDSPVHEFTPVPPEVAASAAEPPEVAAFAAEPPEVVSHTFELPVCPVTAMEAIHELTVPQVTVMEAVYELTVCPVTATEAIHEFPALSAPPWLPALSWLPVPLHGPGPPSFPLFRLRSTTLLDFLSLFGLGWVLRLGVWSRP